MSELQISNQISIWIYSVSSSRYSVLFSAVYPRKCIIRNIINAYDVDECIQASFLDVSLALRKYCVDNY